MSHIHVIDGKNVSMLNDACTICHPEATQQQTQEKEILPRVYRKGNCSVLKISKGQLITTTFWSAKTAYLMTISKMARDGAGKVMVTQDNKVIWTKQTVRLSPAILKAYVMELSKLIADNEADANVPTRA